jgi:radical SAM superfamily enzyme YgiQ (UPF0313 family)
VATLAETRSAVHGRRSGAPRALLLAPPIYDFALYDLFLKPFALCRLAAWLQSCGFRVRLVNGLDYRDPESCRQFGRPRREARGTGKLFRQVVPKPACLGWVRRHYARYGMLASSLQRELAREQPDIVLVSSGMTYWYPGVVEAIARLRGLYPRVPVILGGIYATLCPAHARRVTEADYVVEGEAWPGIARILSRLHLPQAAPWRPEAFTPLPEGRWEGGVLRLNTGCPLRCRYCASPVLCPRFRAGDPQAAFAALSEMYGALGTRSFAFYDDALLAESQAVLEPFLERVIASGLELSFYAPNGVHAALLEPALASLMRRAGFRELGLGVESLRGEFHRTLDRKLDPHRLPQALEALFSAGFTSREITGYILAGLPGQRWEEVEESLVATAALGIRVQVTEYSPVPGTPLWAEAVRRSRLALEEEPLAHNNTLLPMQWAGLELADLQRLKELARKL